MTEVLALSKTAERFSALALSLVQEAKLMIDYRSPDAYDLVAIISHAARIAVGAATSLADFSGREDLAMEVINQAANTNEVAAELVLQLAKQSANQVLATRVEGQNLILGLAREQIRTRRQLAGH